jgi:membrane protein insertase Oxa1/YidC/SpoIIIJ
LATGRRECPVLCVGTGETSSRRRWWGGPQSSARHSGWNPLSIRGEVLTDWFTAVTAGECLARFAHRTEPWFAVEDNWLAEQIMVRILIRLSRGLPLKTSRATKKLQYVNCEMPTSNLRRAAASQSGVLSCRSARRDSPLSVLHR